MEVRGKRKRGDGGKGKEVTEVRERGREVMEVIELRGKRERGGGVREREMMDVRGKRKG